MKRTICLILAAVIALTTAACDFLTPKDSVLLNEPSELLVHFIDVGQGDCILLESKGEFVLIDTGEREYAGTVRHYLNTRGVRVLKYVIATHPHSDHIGGMDQVLDSMDTRNFITSETDQSTDTWLKVLDAVERNDVNYIDAVPGSTYFFGDANFTVLAPLGGGYEGYNDYSVVTKVRCGKVSFLLTGDAEKVSEEEMIASGADLTADVLKCGHHGSSTSSTAKFLKAVRPACAVISCGKDNDYGHPHRGTIKKLNILGCQIYRTDLMSTVVARTDGTTITFSDVHGKKLGEYIHSDERLYEAYYVGNLSSHVFHMARCPGARSMNEENRVVFDTREEAIAQGYTPCGQCEP